MARDKHLTDIMSLLDVDEVDWSGYATYYGYPIYSVAKNGRAVQMSYERGDIKVYAVANRLSPDDALSQLSDLMTLVATISNHKAELIRLMKDRVCGGTR